jgi:hypothetical protein
MDNDDRFKERKLEKIQLIIYLIPMVGWIPSLWTLYIRPDSSEKLSLSRLSVRLTFIWVLAYSLLWLGSLQSSEILTLRLLYVNGLLTSGYILTCLGLMLKVWKQKK